MNSGSAMRTAYAHQDGFTLVELALVLLVLGVATWAVAGSYANIGLVAERDQARAHGQTMQNALRSFALIHGRLPCPDSIAIGSGNSGWETVTAPGDCAVATTQAGMLPYKSLGLDLPVNGLRAAYGVFRNAAVNADLTRLAERTDLPALPSSQLDAKDLIVALNLAGIATTTPSAAHLYLTGDGQSLGAVDCGANVRSNQAFILVIPLRNRDGTGNDFDGVHNTFAAGTSVCASAPGTPHGVLTDDVVVAESFTSLSGWLTARSS